jgi:hypothetical protein
MLRNLSARDRVPDARWFALSPVRRAEPVPRAAAPEPLLSELSSRDVQRLGIGGGETVEVYVRRHPPPSECVRPDWSPVGTAFGAEGIATDSVNALTDAAIIVPKSEAGRDSETFAGLFDDDSAGAEGYR